MEWGLNFLIFPHLVVEPFFYNKYLMKLLHEINKFLFQKIKLLS